MANEVLYYLGMLGLLIYLGFALRRVYRQSWLKTIVKTLLLSVYLIGLFIFYFAVVLVFAFLRSKS